MLKSVLATLIVAVSLSAQSEGGTGPAPAYVFTFTSAPSAPVQTGSVVTIAMTLSLSDNTPLAGTESVVADLSQVGGASSATVAAQGGGAFSITFVASYNGPAHTRLVSFTATNGAISGAGQINVVVYQRVNDVLSGALTVSLGENGPFENYGVMAPAEAGFANSGCLRPLGFGPPGTIDYGTADVFFKFVPSLTGPITVATCGGDNLDGSPAAVWLDTFLQVYDAWTPGVGPQSMVACSEDALGTTCGSLGRESRVTFSAIAGVVYLIRVSCHSGSQGEFVLNLYPSTAQIQPIGTGCGAVVGTLWGNAPPVLDSTGSIIVTSEPAATGVLMFSLVNFGSEYTVVGPCTLYLSLNTLTFLFPIVTDAAGQWYITTVFPSDALFIGFGGDLQALLVGAGGPGLTNGLRLIIGS